MTDSATARSIEPGGRLLRAYRATALVFLNVVLLLALCELGAGLLLRMRNPASANTGVSIAGPNMAYYHAKPWGAPFWEEFIAARQLSYAPYVVFRRRPFKGRYVNIDAERRRVVPGSRCASASEVIWMFGGSTMWGTGAPDSLTIPALLLARLAPGHPAPICVVNFGESAWVSSQELVQLTLALRDGGRPGTVIFYDGVNDVYAAFQSGHAGGHQNEASLATRYEESSWWRQAIRQSLFASLVIRAVAGRGPAGPPDPGIADSVVTTYLGVVDAVRQLGRAYGFRTLFFWQPVIHQSGKRLTPREVGVAREQPDRLIRLYAASYARMKREAALSPGLFDISGALAAEEGELFIDWAHVVPEANARVADAMFKAFNDPRAGLGNGVAPTGPAHIHARSRPDTP